MEEIIHENSEFSSFLQTHTGKRKGTLAKALQVTLDEVIARGAE